MWEDTVCMLSDQKRPTYDYTDIDVLPKVNKAAMTAVMEITEEYHRLYCGVVRAPLSDIIRNNIIVQTYDDYPRYVIPDNEMITMMLHLPLDKNKLLTEKEVSSVKENKAE